MEERRGRTSLVEVDYGRKERKKGEVFQFTVRTYRGKLKIEK